MGPVIGVFGKDIRPLLLSWASPSPEAAECMTFKDAFLNLLKSFVFFSSLLIIAEVKCP